MQEVTKPEPVSQANWLDRLIMFVSPERGRKRLLERKMTAIQQTQIAAWEAARTDNRRSDNWMASKLSPDSALELDQPLMRQRARVAYRDDQYFSGAVKSRVTNAYSQFTPQARIGELEGVITKDQARELNKLIEDYWDQWAPTAGVGGFTFQQVISLAGYSKGIDGEAGVVWSDIKRPDRIIPLAIECIDMARLETPPDKESDSTVRLGIKKDKLGYPVEYYVRKTHPDDTKVNSDEYFTIPAERFLHLFDLEMPGQSRGIPWAVAALAKLKDLKDMSEAELLSAQISACFSMFIEVDNQTPLPTTDNASVTDANGNPLQEMVGGQIAYVKGGKPQFANPQRPGSTFTPFVELNLRSIAAALNWPYELVAKDWSKTTYSSGRLSLIDGRIVIRVEQRSTKERILSPLWNRFVDELSFMGLLPIDPEVYDTHKHHFHKHSWTGQAQPWIDPVKEVKASADAIGACLSTLADEVAATGRDWEDLLEQKAREQERQKELGIEVVRPFEKSGTTSNDPQLENTKVLSGLVEDLGRMIEELAVAVR